MLFQGKLLFAFFQTFPRHSGRSTAVGGQRALRHAPPAHFAILQSAKPAPGTPAPHRPLWTPQPQQAPLQACHSARLHPAAASPHPLLAPVGPCIDFCVRFSRFGVFGRGRQRGEQARQTRLRPANPSVPVQPDDSSMDALRCPAGRAARSRPPPPAPPRRPASRPAARLLACSSPR